LRAPANPGARLVRSWQFAIALLATVAIPGSSCCCARSGATPGGRPHPLLAALALGGVRCWSGSCAASSARVRSRRRAGISIVTSILLGEYLGRARC
jgi:hypothetical protein